MLSSSDDEGDSYSSDGEESNNLVIDANNHSVEVNQNGHPVDSLSFSPPSESAH